MLRLLPGKELEYAVTLTTHTTRSSKSAVNCAPGPRERDPLGHDAMGRAVQPAPPHPHLTDPSAQVKVPPAGIDTPQVIPRRRRERAQRTGQHPPPQRHVDHDRTTRSGRAQLDARHPDPGQIQDTIE